MTKPAVYTSITLVATILAGGQILRSQALAPTDRQWEYASVTSGQTWGEQTALGAPYKWFASAYTCFAASSGCRSAATVQAETSGATDVGTAMMKAASALGEEGWEMVSATSGENGNRVMYFRRPKSAQK